MRPVAGCSKQPCLHCMQCGNVLISLLDCSGNKKKTKNLQNASNIDKNDAKQAFEGEDLEGSEQAKSTKKNGAADRPSRADAQVSMAKLLSFVNCF